MIQRADGRVVLLCLRLAVVAAIAAGSLRAQSSPATTPSPEAPATLRFHGLIEPIRSYTVVAPRLTGSGPTPGVPFGQLVIVRLARAGTMVKKGDLLVEFDRNAQLKAAHDRESEYRDFLEQLNRKRGELITAKARADSELVQAENQVKIAELDVLNNEMAARIVAEKNTQALEEARAHVAQLRKTIDLRRRVDAADLKTLEIQRDRARNAWEHARRNTDKMQILSPLDGLVVLRSIWKQGAMGEVQEGEEVRAGIPLLDVVDPSAMRVRALVNQADIEHLQTGQPARITLDSYPSRQFSGHLERLSAVATTSALSPRVRTFLAVFSIEGNDPHVLPDLAAAIDVTPAATRIAAPTQ